MNRELKFRAWDEKSFLWDKGGFYFYVNDPFLKQGYVIQQYTGLKDKNGREIYEGDFCNRENWSGNPYYVRYSKDGWFWRRHNETDEEFLKHRDCFYDSDRLRNGIENCEIIGNILENPELLK